MSLSGVILDMWQRCFRDDGTDRTAIKVHSKIVDTPGVTSAGNTSTTPLGSSEVFTGDWEDVSNFAYFSLSVISDQASAANGLEFQWSSNGVDVDRNEPTNILAGVGRAFAITPRAKYFRMKLTNGSVAQTFLRLQTVFHLHGMGHITKTLKQSVTEENFAFLTQSPIMAKKFDGTYLNIAGLDLNQAALLGTVEAFPILSHLGYGFGVATGTVSTGGTNERAMILIDNPSGSGKNLHFETVLFGIPENGVTFYTLYLNPTVTANGTPLTVVGKKQSGQQSPVTNWYSIPTVSAFGTRIGNFRSDQSSAQFQQDWNLAQHLEPGNKMLITAVQSLAGQGGYINAEYVEI